MSHRFFRKRHSFHRLYVGLTLVAVLSLLTACQTFTFSQPTPTSSTSALTAPPLVPITFQVTVPATTSSGDVILEVVDEVTGTALNSQRHTMKPIGEHFYALELGFPAGSVIRYRYLHQEIIPQIERNPYGQPVRYRLAVARAPAIIEDRVVAWQGSNPVTESGRLVGQVFDATTHTPIADALVCMAGIQTYTASDGTFTLENLPNGKHNLVVLPIEGSYHAFQQEAVIATNAVTPAQIALQPARLVNVTFVVQPPPEHIRGLPMRIVGNLRSLGNTFADLEGGLSVLASRAPLLSLLDDGRYTFTLSLPEGTDLRYKYTLGDGFWNAEHAADGSFKVRQLIVPDHDITINDQIETWRMDGSETNPLTLYIKTPAETPEGERVSIQFRLYAWTPAIPMWPLGNQQWLYVFYSPQRALGNVSYRVCRNEQCGLADDLSTAGNTAAGLPLISAEGGNTITHQVERWSNLIPWTYSPPSTENAAWRSSFVAAVELAPHVSPISFPHLPATLKSIRELSATWVILSPTWSLTSITLPHLEYMPANDISGADLSALVSNAQQQGLNVALYPRINPFAITQALSNNPGSTDAWLAEYHRFILHMADKAMQTRAQALILGGPESDNFLSDHEEAWRDLIGTIRQKFPGLLIWAITEEQIQNHPAWVDQMDGVYVLASTLPTDGALDDTQLTAALGEYLDTLLLPFSQQIGKPIWIGLNYPSAQSIQSGCVTSQEGCLTFERLIWNGSILGQSPDLDRQARLYQAIAAAVNTRPWISGLVARGYQPAVDTTDVSPSVRGKPAAVVLNAWFQAWTNVSP
ncbi:hypothetical protein [uncultured Thermanaerothrix sp.]|uniref:glycoside hydrolase family 113 n=1 Tax=uncultured Thermanaerothrix sp. TaxID=1195149 RepID=UPI002606CCA0|nr:hypothetical protein [uncultured Thermanaerothrix sp.]